METAAEPVVAWLLDGDPAIRWQTMRDLLDAAPGEVEAERARVAREGWGAALLERQDPEGTWARGLYNPKWTSTFHTLLLLRQMGLGSGHPQAARGVRLLLDRGFREGDGGLLYTSNRLTGSVGKGRGETCIGGMGLGIFSHFRLDDGRVEALAGHILREQMPDGGWNCRYRRGATHASFNTTILALEGLLEWERCRGPSPEVTDARRRGEEFLLQHRLFRSHRTGEVVKAQFTRMAFPPGWHYDVLRALDYFQAAGAERDERVEEAVALLESKRLHSGQWPRQGTHAGSHWFEMEPPRQPSRWNTLRMLRVLRWWRR